MALLTFSVLFANLKAIGVYPIFTSLVTPFVITGITCVAVDVTGSPNGASISIGTNPPNYDNFVADLRCNVTSDDTYQYYSIGGTVLPVIPPLSNVQIKVSNPDTGATTNVQRIDVTGYYL